MLSAVGIISRPGRENRLPGPPFPTSDMFKVMKLRLKTPLKNAAAGLSCLRTTKSEDSDQLN